jgi:hypothetical protein
MNQNAIAVFEGKINGTVKFQEEEKYINSYSIKRVK